MTQKNKQKHTFVKSKDFPNACRICEYGKAYHEQPESGQDCSNCLCHCPKGCAFPKMGHIRQSCSHCQDKEEGICPKHKTKLHCLDCLGEKIEYLSKEGGTE